MHDFSPIAALIGGGFIGLAASLFLLAHGRVCGISGLFAGLLRRDAGIHTVRLAFVAGLVVSGVVLRLFSPSVLASDWQPSALLALPAGLLVGFGTQLGNGCTSGHGVCGLSRLSRRSLVATGTFMFTAFFTVFVTRHLIGGIR